MKEPLTESTLFIPTDLAYVILSADRASGAHHQESGLQSPQDYWFSHARDLSECHGHYYIGFTGTHAQLEEARKFLNVLYEDYDFKDTPRHVEPEIAPGEEKGTHCLRLDVTPFLNEPQKLNKAAAMLCRRHALFAGAAGILATGAGVFIEHDARKQLLQGNIPRAAAEGTAGGILAVFGSRELFRAVKHINHTTAPHESQRRQFSRLVTRLTLQMFYQSPRATPPQPVIER